jgi:hypothetical protein
MMRKVIHWLGAKKPTLQAVHPYHNRYPSCFQVPFGWPIRFDSMSLYDPDINQVLLMLSAPAIGVPIMYAFGLYSSITRYVGEHAFGRFSRQWD